MERHCCLQMSISPGSAKIYPSHPMFSKRLTITKFGMIKKVYGRFSKGEWRKGFTALKMEEKQK